MGIPFLLHLISFCNNPCDIMAHSRGRKVNFGAGPAVLPETVLHQFGEDLINFEGTGVGIGELSHRTGTFETGVLEAATESLHSLTGYSRDAWTVLWMTGGGTGQFAAVPLNLAGQNGSAAIYLVTGVWSEKAAEEAIRILGPLRVLIVDLREGNTGRSLKCPIEQVKAVVLENPRIAYIYYCDNETVDGVELPDPNYFQDRLSSIVSAPFVCDSSSNFLSRPLPRASGPTGLIFAGVQKNLGAAGVTVVLMKRELLEGERVFSFCPSVMNYALMAKNNSLLNTPPVMAIHMCNLMLKHLRNRFTTLQDLDRFSLLKSGKLYSALEASGRYVCPVSREFRSRMNVVFKALDAVDEAEFLKRTLSAGLIQLKGHRSVGGFRASLYNALEEAEVDKLISLL